MSLAEIERQRQQLALHQKPDGSVYLLDVYETPQQYGYCSILFSLVQTLVLVIMMWQCGIAPLTVNPMVGPPPDVLDYWGAKNTPKIVEDGEGWRLMTPMLLHAGIFHWMGNISVQLETGLQFECEWGSGVWCIVYLTSTVGSSILSVIMMPQSLSVGSSGAVMGLFGAKLSEILIRSCEPNKTLQQKVGHAMRKHQFILAGGGCILVMVFSFIPLWIGRPIWGEW
ncbi:RHOMBOID-like protein [Seminavis robusta]|uniref:rhomboid protease n=1 Tax=Seminavis robusta TaxID=568900 RepID=A0A9N8F4T5_9STRA|nr:RHOMBOID-like protein [Seminavis robusta]|eukprot:Sro2988_g341740.1 RHOMBOID-like protein (226) ;mRNA; r:6245-6922